MAFKIGDKENLLSELKCAKCLKLLSVFPIYTSSSVGNVCGRCTESIESMISNNSVERYTAYESLAKYVLFPCSNKEFGCETNLEHDEVVNHEKCCSYRQLICPFKVDACDKLFQCNWKGATINLNTHLELSHTSREINNSHFFVLNTEETNVKVNFVKVECYTFITITRYDGETNKFYCLVMCCDEEEVLKNYAYQIELGRGSFRLTYSKSNPEVLIETSEALEKVDTMIVVDVSAVTTLLGNLDSNLYCRITITKETNEIAESTLSKEQINSKSATSTPNEVPNRSAAEQKLLQSNKLILKELECPVCNNYMSSLIYICTKGHSLCNDCKKKVVQCPICRVQPINIRNISLETLTQKVLYPCKYSVDGCTEVLNGDEIAKHQITCDLRRDCPLIMLPISCKVKKGVYCPIEHIAEEHCDDWIFQNQICKITVTDAVDTYNYNVTVSDNDIFIYCHTYDANKREFKFNFLHLNQKTHVPVYRYILEFGNDLSKFRSQLRVKKVCQAVPPCITDAFKNCLTIPMCMLKSYIRRDEDEFEDISQHEYDYTSEHEFEDEILYFKFKIEKI